MQYKNIVVDEKDMIGKITLNRPPLNILNIEMMGEISGALRHFRDRNIKVLVVNASGKAFSAGVDISEHTADKAEDMIKSFHRTFEAMRQVNAPIVAVVKGSALGGGCELAVFCDLVIASEKAQFGQPEIKVGVFPPVAAAVFPKLTWSKKALELILTGEVVGAAEAKALGLVNVVLPAENFETEAERFIAEKLASNSAVVLQLTKRAFIEGATHDYGEAIMFIERIYMLELMKTKDAHEGLAAFLEKRQPAWKNE